MSNIASLTDHFKQVKAAEKQLRMLGENIRHEVLLELADLAERSMTELLAANRLDLDRMDPKDPKYDRLQLTENRIIAICNDLRHVSKLPTPLAKKLEVKELSNGLKIEKVSVPIGTIGIVFESRPNVTFDVFALCFKSGNACILKGSRDAQYSNRFIVELIHKALNRYQLPEYCVFLAPSSREALLPVLEAIGFVDMVIPRGSQGLIDFVRLNSKVPVIETGAGIVHTYVDKEVDLNQAKAIIRNAKTRRVSVCNALDTLIVHKARLKDIPTLLDGLDEEFDLHIYADPDAYKVLAGYYQNHLLSKAEDQHYGTEFLSMQMSIKCVDNINEAVDHIDQYSSKHSEAILSTNAKSIELFQNQVDAAVVYANTSTAFTDGGQFGMGAEIGISTQKLHARGPMALAELTSYKWIVTGNGQIRPK